MDWPVGLSPPSDVDHWSPATASTASTTTIYNYDSTSSTTAVAAIASAASWCGIYQPNNKGDYRKNTDDGYDDFKHSSVKGRCLVSCQMALLTRSPLILVLGQVPTGLMDSFQYSLGGQVKAMLSSLMYSAVLESLQDPHTIVNKKGQASVCGN